jgi:hypothetical protein
MAFTSRDLTVSLRMRGHSSSLCLVCCVDDLGLVGLWHDDEEVEEEMEEERRDRKGERDDSVLERPRDFSDVNAAAAGVAGVVVVWHAGFRGRGRRGRGMLISVYRGPSYSTWNTVSAVDTVETSGAVGASCAC